MTKLLTDDELKAIHDEYYYKDGVWYWDDARAIETAVIAKMLALIGKPVAWAEFDAKGRIFDVFSRKQTGMDPLYKLPKELK